MILHGCAAEAPQDQFIIRVFSWGIGRKHFGKHNDLSQGCIPSGTAPSARNRAYSRSIRISSKGVDVRGNGPPYNICPLSPALMKFLRHERAPLDLIDRR